MRRHRTSGGSSRCQRRVLTTMTRKRQNTFVRDKRALTAGPRRLNDRCSAKAYFPLVKNNEYPLHRRAPIAVQVLLLSKLSASTQQVFLPDKQALSNHNAVFSDRGAAGLDQNGSDPESDPDWSKEPVDQRSLRLCVLFLIG